MAQLETEFTLSTALACRIREIASCIFLRLCYPFQTGQFVRRRGIGVQDASCHMQTLSC